MSYSLDSAGPPLPSAHFRCRVVDAATGQPVVGKTVRLGSQAGTLYGAATTDSAGEINILRQVPAIPLQLQVDLATGDRAESPVISEDQTSLNDLDKAEEASKLRSSELAFFSPVSHPESWLAD